MAQTRRPNGIRSPDSAVAVCEKQARVEAERLALERAAVLEQITDGVIVVSDEGEITLANAAARRLLGVTQLCAADILVDGEPSTVEVMDADGRPYPRKDFPLSRALTSGETVADAELRIRRGDGSEIEIQASATPVVDESGTRLGAVLLFRDVTAQRAFERRKSEFIATISHELRTPLTVIKGQAQYLARHLDGGGLLGREATLSRLATIDETATQLNGMANRLIDVTRGTPVQLAEPSQGQPGGLLPKSHQLLAVQQVARTLVEELNLERVADVIAEQSLLLFGAAAAGVWLVDTDRDRVNLLGRHGIRPPPPEAQSTLPDMPLSAATFPAAAARTGRPLEVRDIAALGPEFELSRRFCQAEGLRSVLAQPLFARGHVVGVLTILFAAPHTFVPEERELIRAMGDLWSIAIDNARLYGEVQRKEEERTTLLDREHAAREEAEAENARLRETNRRLEKSRRRT